MAASDPHPPTNRLHAGAGDYLAGTSLFVRVQEEIARSERHGTDLSCLLVAIEPLTEEEAATEAHTPAEEQQSVELHEQMLAYVAGALERELRRFDRVGRPSERELLIVLPGADRQRGERVARRVLERLRAIKLESGGKRKALSTSIGLATWSEQDDAKALVHRASAAAGAGGAGEMAAPLSAHARIDAASLRAPNA